MFQNFFQDLSRRSARVSLFLFFSLLSLSMTFYVMADDTISTDKNIFQDSDQDGLSNDEEVLYKTDSLNKDTDGDGYMDGVEVEGGYDPTKMAPGDKLVVGVQDRESENVSGDVGMVSITDQVAQKIAGIVRDETTGERKDVSADDINITMESIMSQTDQEIVLPEVDLDKIKVKEVSKKLKGNARVAQEKDDAVQYLTVMAYILANNSPKKFHTQSSLSSVLTSYGTESLSAVMFGNDQYLEDLAKSGKKMLKEIEDIEVPENMLEIHAKAIKMAQYSTELKDEAKERGDGGGDPLGQIASLSKIQGFLGVVTEFSLDISQQLSDLGIQEIPLNL